ncbi:MAG: sensor domain-containing diguanylate cyclase [Methylotenera sp.]|nr:sensor domain-containing diguanylate cyclase [Methylotenera sp.]
MNYYNFEKFRVSLKRNLALIGYAIITFCLFLIIFEYLIAAQSAKSHAQQRIEASNYASVLKSKIDHELNSILFISTGLSSYFTVYHDHIEPKKVNAMLADLYSRTKLVRNFAVAVNTRITYVYPIETNKQIVGMDYQDLRKQWPEVKKAIDSHEGLLAGPLDLLQGGKGLIYRYPVFIDGQYWGLLSTVIDTPEFFKAAFSDVSDHYELGIRVRDFNGQVSKAFYGDDHLFMNRQAYRTISSVPNAEWEWAILSKSGKDLTVPFMIRALVIGMSLAFAYIVFFFLKERTTLASHAMYDSLTGLANRRLLYDRMDQAQAQSKRLDHYFGIMFIDIDYFKKINDTYGHDFGDELLKTVAVKLLGCIRDVDTLSRIGGDEFVVVIEQLGNKDDVELVAKKIFASFEHQVNIMGKDILIGLSIGISIYTPHSSSNVKSLMKEADIALYEVKACGRNSYKIFTKED